MYDILLSDMSIFSSQGYQHQPNPIVRFGRNVSHIVMPFETIIYYRQQDPMYTLPPLNWRDYFCVMPTTINQYKKIRHINIRNYEDIMVLGLEKRLYENFEHPYGLANIVSALRKI